MSRAEVQLGEAVRVLSVIPFFDHDLGVAALTSTGVARDARMGSDALAMAFDVDGIEPFRGLLRVPETLARVFTSKVSLDHQALKSVAAAFVRHANSSMRDDAIGAVGYNGWELQVLCFAVVAEPQSKDAADAIAMRLFAAPDYGRHDDVPFARDTLRRLLGADHPMAEFLDALAAWSEGSRAVAAKRLEHILESHHSTAVRAIGNHLCGVHQHDKAAWSAARGYLRESVRLFRQIGDPIRESRAIISLGDCMRAQGVHERDFTLVTQSLKEFDNAENLIVRTSDHSAVELQQTLGRILIGRSLAQRELGFTNEAIEDAVRAVDQLGGFAGESVWARENLAMLLRLQGRSFDALEALLPVLEGAGSDVETQKAMLAVAIELASNPEFLDPSDENSLSTDDADAILERGIELAADAKATSLLMRLQLARVQRHLSRWRDGSGDDSQVARELQVLSDFTEKSRVSNQLQGELSRQVARFAFLQEEAGEIARHTKGIRSSRGEPVGI